MVEGMRILVHDYSGHPFQIELSRCLARRGHTLSHVYSASFQTPKGDLATKADDPDTLDIVGLSLAKTFQKNSFFKRRSQEIEFGRMVARQIKHFRPDIVVSSNAPLDTQALIYKAARACAAKFVFWLQDIYSEAISRVVPKALPVFGGVIAARYRRLEYSLLRRSDHVVAITEDFVSILRRQGVAQARVSVVENWAPLSEMTDAGSETALPAGEEGQAHAIYAGTLGYKHNPDILLAAAKQLPVSIEVFSEGKVADSLSRRASEEGVANLSVRAWVPFGDLPKVLAKADILIAMIEQDAGIFSVPSKVLTYLCCGKPILAAIPTGNLARRIIERVQAGLVSSPSDAGSFIENLRKLAGDVPLRKALGANGRDYAEKNFDIQRIGDRFEGIFAGLFLPELKAI